MRRAPLTFLLIFFALSSQAQSPDSLLAQTYRHLYALNDSSQYEAVVTEGERFLTDFQTTDTLSPFYADVLFIIGTGHYNYGADGNKAFWYTERALAIFERLDHVRAADCYERLAECHYWYTGDYKAAIGLCEKALAIHWRKNTTCKDRQSNVYLTLGMVYTAIRDFQKADYYYKSAQSCENSDLQMAKVYASIGSFYTYQGLAREALSYRLSALEAFKKVYKKFPDHGNMGVVYAEIGLSLQNSGAFSQAISYYTKAKEIFDKRLEPGAFNRQQAEMNIGFCLSELGRCSEAIEILRPLGERQMDMRMKTNIWSKLALCYARERRKQEFEDLMPRLCDAIKTCEYPNEVERGTMYRNAANAYGIALDYAKAKLLYREAILFCAYHPIPDYQTLAYIEMDLGYTDYALSQTDSSIAHFEKSLPVFQDTASLAHYFAAYGLALSYHQKFEKTRQPLWLEKAIAYMNTCVNAILHLRNDYVEAEDKQFLNSDGNIVFAQLIEMLFQQDKLKPDPKLRARCFTLAEQNKGMLLLESLQSALLSDSSTLVDSIRAASQSMRQWEANAKKIIPSDTLSEALAKEKAYFEAGLFTAKQHHAALVEKLKTQEPKLFRALYQPEIVSVEQVQKGLSSGEAMVEYVLGDSSIFIFVVRPDAFHIRTVARNFDLDGLIDGLRNGITGYHGLPKKQQRNHFYDVSKAKYDSCALRLYQKLLAPVQDLLPKAVASPKGKKVPRLIIVPDGKISLVPFDVLICEKPRDPYDWKQYFHLVYDYQISYAYSATLRQQMRDLRHDGHRTKPFAVFAPFAFNNEKNNKPDVLRQQFGILPYTLQEMRSLHRLMGGDTVARERATKWNFVKNASNYRILHIATHAVANQQTGELAFLVFYGPENGPDTLYLYAKELYGLLLHADMVVTSACETNVGSVKLGEGVISLARAFAYAGVKSVVTSLWPVKEKPTGELMERFYDGLKKGLPKDEALRNARLGQIEAASGETAHPFFWAAFVPLGDMR